MLLSFRYIMLLLFLSVIIIFQVFEHSAFSLPPRYLPTMLVIVTKRFVSKSRRSNAANSIWRSHLLYIPNTVFLVIIIGCLVCVQAGSGRECDHNVYATLERRRRFTCYLAGLRHLQSIFNSVYEYGCIANICFCPAHICASYALLLYRFIHMYVHM